MEWIDRNITGWELLKKVENMYPYDSKYPNKTSQSDFYIFKAT